MLAGARSWTLPFLPRHGSFRFRGKVRGRRKPSRSHTIGVTNFFPRLICNEIGRPLAATLFGSYFIACLCFRRFRYLSGLSSRCTTIHFHSTISSAAIPIATSAITHFYSGSRSTNGTCRSKTAVRKVRRSKGFPLRLSATKLHNIKHRAGDDLLRGLFHTQSLYWRRAQHFFSFLLDKPGLAVKSFVMIPFTLFNNATQNSL